MTIFFLYYNIRMARRCRPLEHIWRLTNDPPKRMWKDIVRLNIYIIGLSVFNKNVCFITCVYGLYYYEFWFSENHKRSVEKFWMVKLCGKVLQIIAVFMYAWTCRRRGVVLCVIVKSNRFVTCIFTYVLFLLRRRLS